VLSRVIGSAATAPKSAAVAASLDVDAQPSTGSVRPSLSGDHQVQREGRIEERKGVRVRLGCVPIDWPGECGRRIAVRRFDCRCCCGCCCGGGVTPWLCCDGHAPTVWLGQLRWRSSLLLLLDPIGFVLRLVGGGRRQKGKERGSSNSRLKNFVHVHRIASTTDQQKRA